jgi:hypothetical protein
VTAAQGSTDARSPSLTEWRAASPKVPFRNKAIVSQGTSIVDQQQLK